MGAHPGAAAASSLLAALVSLVDRIPAPPPPPRRGRPAVYPDRLVLEAAVVMVVERLPRVGTLLTVLAEPPPELRRLRAQLTERGRFPVRRSHRRSRRAAADGHPHLTCPTHPQSAARRKERDRPTVPPVLLEDEPERRLR